MLYTKAVQDKNDDISDYVYYLLCVYRHLYSVIPTKSPDQPGLHAITYYNRLTVDSLSNNTFLLNILLDETPVGAEKIHLIS